MPMLLVCLSTCSGHVSGRRHHRIPRNFSPETPRQVNRDVVMEITWRALAYPCMKHGFKMTLGVLCTSLFLTSALVATPRIAEAAGGGAIEVRPSAAVKSKPVHLVPQPGTQADHVARQLIARNLANDHQAGDKPLVLVAAAPVTKDAKEKALFVQLQSARECGSGGCNTLSFRFTNGRWERILDTIGGSVEVDATTHAGMHDLIVDNSQRYVWNGTKYVDNADAADG